MKRGRAFVVLSPENRVRPVWRWLALRASHTSNETYSSDREELGNTSPRLRVFTSVTSILIIVHLLVVFVHLA